MTNLYGLVGNEGNKLVVISICFCFALWCILHQEKRKLNAVVAKHIAGVNMKTDANNKTYMYLLKVLKVLILSSCEIDS